MINVALIGAGRIGQVHSANILAHPESRLAAIVDAFPEVAQSLSEKTGAPVKTLEEVMADNSIDAVVIGSATDTHADFIELAARSGKAIFCEKPVDLSLERVQACLKVVEECKVPLLVGFNRRFDPNFAAVRNRYQQGQIGKAESVLIVSRDPSPPPVSYIQRSGGLFRDMTIHDFDMACYLVDEPVVAVTARGSCVVDPAIGEAGDIDTATITLEFASGALGTIVNTRRSGFGYDQRIELLGAEGLLRAENQLENTVLLANGQGASVANPQYFFLERYSAAFRAEWAHFVDVALGRVECLSGGKEGEQALRLADAALESYTTGKTVRL
ncbi:inositol 2-dehydrogenase [Oceanisphaera psychrotolerans]|uniref:Inositol 2-dehydrogenase n=1 Tax=Oceanisphaera psychrotolerans TaxID=1414654 RepID=A0A1J4QF85_9GAMM|nr:inositol 2-dehydrogenase [Oceanisphaera psychrotolerans]OIN12481.1 inositol 2-dehydrogenase [Oceanisphaera psychrotolerans]